jgi:hypothetical protein
VHRSQTKAGEKLRPVWLQKITFENSALGCLPYGAGNPEPGFQGRIFGFVGSAKYKNNH